MAESIVQVTEGSGKKLHTFQRTIGANVIEDEVVLQGLNYLATYNVSGFAVNTATANSHMLQIMAGASLNVYITRIRMYQATLATAAVLGVFEVRRLTTAGTGGTAITAIPWDSTDSAAGAAGMTLPTVKGTEGNALHLFSVYMLQTLPTAVDFNAMRWELVPDLLRMKAIRIPAGTTNGIAIKNATAIAAGQLTIDVEFIEANF